jgi:sulfonate transport system substrate-binding protein
MKKLLSIALAALLPGAAALAADQGWPDVVRLGLVGNAYNKPFTSAAIGEIQATQSFDREAAKHGTKVQWNFFSATGPAINEAWANHTIDLGSSGDLPSLIGLAGGLKIKVLAGSGREQSIYVGVLTGNPATQWGDLKGKKVTFQKGTYFQLVFDRILRDRGESENDYQVFSLLTANQIIALQAGQVDAVIGTTSLLTYQKQGQVRIIYHDDYQHDAKYLGFGNVSITQEYIDKYPDLVQAFVNQYVDAAILLAQPSHLAEAFRLLAQTGSTSSEVIQDEGKEPYANRINPLLGPKWLAHQNDVIQEIKGYGLIRKTFDINDKVDLRFLNKAIEGKTLPSAWDPS